MSILQTLPIVFLAMSSFAYAMQDDFTDSRSQHISIIKFLDKDIAKYKKTVHENPEKSNQKGFIQAFFDAYMQKAACHYHLNEKNSQLNCYQEILKIPGLSTLSLARTHVNISVVYAHLKRCLTSAVHLQKAEELAPISDIEKIIGPEVFSIFANGFDRAGEDLYLNYPEQALVYQKKAIQVPRQAENWYALAHLKLAVVYDRLLMSEETLGHALLALKCQSLLPKERDKALCFAALGSSGVNKHDDCLKYFNQIKNLEDLHPNEYCLILTTVGTHYLIEEKWEKGIEYRRKALDVLDPSSPQYLDLKYNLATAYGASGNKEKEIEFYNEVLEVIKNNTFDKERQKSVRTIQMLIDLFFFMQEIYEMEKRLTQETSQPRKNELKLDQSINQQKDPQKNQVIRKKAKEKLRLRCIDEIRHVQREAFERERQLDQARKKRIEEERMRMEERKKQIIPISVVSSIEDQNTTQRHQYVLEEREPKVKTRGVAAQIEKPEDETKTALVPIFPTLPNLGTRAQDVFNKISDEDWNFTREDYEHYLEDFQCKKRDSGGAHRIFQLPKTTIITLKKDGQEMLEHMFFADEDVKLGSVTLPAWRGKHIPFYLRKQLRDFHEKIVKIYTVITKIQTKS